MDEIERLRKYLDTVRSFTFVSEKDQREDLLGNLLEIRGWCYDALKTDKPCKTSIVSGNNDLI